MIFQAISHKYFMANITSISLSVNASTIKLYGSTTFIVTATYSDGTTRDITDFCSYTIPSGTSSTSSGVTTVSNNIITLTHAAGTDISFATVTCASKTYTGSTLTASSITVVYGGTTLVENRDYEVTSNYGGTTVGSYNVTITGIGSYRNSASGTFSITKANPSYTAPTAKSGLTYSGSSQTLYNAGSNTTAGSFSYSNGTRTSAGSQTVSWSFTPTDTNNYNSVSGSFTGTIGQATGILNISTIYNNNITIGDYTTIQGSFTGDGTISCSSNNTSIATTRVSYTYGNSFSIEITGVSKGDVTITINLSSGTNYTGDSFSKNFSIHFYGIGILYTDNTISNYNTLVSGKTPVGVLMTENTAGKGIVVHPNQWSRVTWGTRNIEISGLENYYDYDSIIGAKMDFNGKTNTDTVISSGYAGTAFTSARNATYADGRIGYLPAAGQVSNILYNRDNMNVAFQRINGTNIDWGYISSSQYYDECWLIALSLDDNYDYVCEGVKHDKTSTFAYCRSVADVQC